MSLVFSYRSDQLDARHGASGTEHGQYLGKGITIVADAAAIGGTAAEMGNPLQQTGLVFAGNLNLSQTLTFSIVQRVKFFNTTTENQLMFSTTAKGKFPTDGVEVYFQGSTKSMVNFQYNAALTGINGTAVAVGATTTLYHDYVWTWDGVAGTATYKIYTDGTLSGSLTPSRAHIAGLGMDIPSFAIGTGEKWHQSNYNLNEFLMYNHVLSSASIASAFTGNSRSTFISATALDGIQSSDPGVGNVVASTTYTINGVSLTGTFAVATYTDPGVANVLSGTGYIFNDSTLSGTYHDPTYTDPGIANVRVSTDYIFNDSTLTGTLNVPTASTGTADTVPLNELKEQIRYVLATNNTSSGAPIVDLSSNIENRVQCILKVNPEKIPPNDNILPALTVFIDSKSTAPNDIARNGATGKRKAEVNIKIAGMVYEPYTNDRIEDPADEDLETLMENAERILRGYDSLGGNVRWQFPTTITYHSLGWDEQAHFRGAIMDLKATVFY